MATTPNSNKLQLLWLCLLPWIAQAALAGDWKITPSIHVSERYTDNVGLDASGGDESSFITDIAPGISIQRQGARARVDVNYSLHGLIYSHDSGANDIQHQLSANLSLEPVQDFFFLDANARVGQNSLSSLGRVGNDYNLSGNRAETRSLSVIPSLRKRFGSFATGQASLTYTLASAADGALSNTGGSNLKMGLSSGSRFNQVPWSLNLSRRSLEGTGRDSDITSLDAYVGYRVSPKLQVGLTLGHDDHSGVSSLARIGGTHGNVSLHWAPTRRTSLGASVGHRYNGNSYGLDFSHRTAHTTWSLRYSESITEPVDFLLTQDVYLCPAEDGSFVIRSFLTGSPAPDGCVFVGTGSSSADDLGLLADPTLSKSWNGNVSYRLGKSVFSLSLNSTRRSILSDAGGSSDRTQARLSWNWRLGPRTTSTVSLTSGTSKASGVAAESDDQGLTWQLTRRLAPKTTANVELRHLSKSGGTSGDYDENTVAAHLNHRF